MISSDTSTRSIFGSVRAAVFMPSLDDERLILDNYPPNFIELSRTMSTIPGQNYWAQPKLRFVSISTNVNMHGFATVENCRRRTSTALRSRQPAARSLRLNRLIVGDGDQVLEELALSFFELQERSLGG